MAGLFHGDVAGMLFDLLLNRAICDSSFVHFKFVQDVHVQRPQSMRPGFAAGTMRVDPGAPSNLLKPMPGAFIAEVPGQGPPPGSIVRGRSQKQKGFSISSLNPFKS